MILSRLSEPIGNAPVQGASQVRLPAPTPTDVFVPSSTSGLSDAELKQQLLRQTSRSQSANREAGQAHEARVESEATLGKELVGVDKRYKKVGETFSPEDMATFIATYHTRHKSTAIAEDDSFDKLSALQARLQQKLDAVESSNLTPSELEQSAKTLYEGYDRLCHTEHAGETVQFVAKVLANKDSKLYAALDGAGLLDKLEGKLLDRALPYAMQGVHKNQEDILQDLAPIWNGDPSKRSELAAKLSTGLPSRIDKAKAKVEQEERREIHGVVKDSFGLSDALRGFGALPTGLAGVGAVVAFTHAATLMNSPNVDHKEVVASTLDGLNQGASLLQAGLEAATASKSLISGVRIGGPIVGGLASAVTVKSTYQHMVEHPDVETTTDFGGDALGIGAGLFGVAAAASLIPGVGLAVATGLGLTSAGLKVASFISHEVNVHRERKQESTEILHSKVASFREVERKEAGP